MTVDFTVRPDMSTYGQSEAARKAPTFTFGETFALLASRGAKPVAQVLLEAGRLSVKHVIQTTREESAAPSLPQEEAAPPPFFSLLQKIVSVAHMFPSSSSSEKSAILWDKILETPVEILASVLYHVLGDPIGAIDSDLFGYNQIKAWKECVEFLGLIASSTSSDPNFRETIQECSRALVDGIKLGEQVGNVSYDLTRIGKNLKEKIDALPPGGYLLIPGEWRERYSQGHATVYEFVKGQDEKSHTLIVHNTGSGADNPDDTGYHEQAITEGKRKTFSYVIQGVSIEKLCSKDFLSLVRTLQIGWCDPEIFFYEKVLPTLGGHVVPFSSTEGVDVQRSGTCTFASVFAFLQTKLSKEYYGRMRLATGLVALHNFVFGSAFLFTEEELLLTMKCSRNLSQILLEAEMSGSLPQNDIASMRKKIACIDEHLSSRARDLDRAVLSQKRPVENKELSCTMPIASVRFAAIKIPLIVSKAEDPTKVERKKIDSTLYQRVSKEHIPEGVLPQYFVEQGSFWVDEKNTVLRIEMPDGSLYEAVPSKNLFFPDSTTIFICDRDTQKRTKEALVPEGELPPYLQAFEESGYTIASTIDGEKISRISFSRLGGKGLSFFFDEAKQVFRREGAPSEILVPDQSLSLLKGPHKLLLRDEGTKEIQVIIPGHFLAKEVAIERYTEKGEIRTGAFSTKKMPKKEGSQEGARSFIPVYTYQKRKKELVPESCEARAQLAYVYLSQQEYEKSARVLEKMERLPVTEETIRILCWIAGIEDTDSRAIAVSLKAEALLKRQEVLFHKKIPEHNSPILEGYLAGRHGAGVVQLSQEEELLLGLPEKGSQVEVVRTKARSKLPITFEDGSWIEKFDSDETIRFLWNFNYGLKFWDIFDTLRKKERPDLELVRRMGAGFVQGGDYAAAIEREARGKNPRQSQLVQALLFAVIQAPDRFSDIVISEESQGKNLRLLLERAKEIFSTETRGKTAVKEQVPITPPQPPMSSVKPEKIPPILYDSDPGKTVLKDVTEIEAKEKEAVRSAKERKQELVSLLTKKSDDEERRLIQESVEAAGFAESPYIQDALYALQKPFPDAFFALNPTLSLSEAAMLRDAAIAYAAEKTYARHLSFVSSELKKLPADISAGDERVCALLKRHRQYDVREAPQNLVLEDSLGYFLSEDQLRTVDSLEHAADKKAMELIFAAENPAVILTLLCQSIARKKNLPVFAIPENLFSALAPFSARMLQESFSQHVFSWAVEDSSPLTLEWLSLIESGLRITLRDGGAVLVRPKDISGLREQFRLAIEEHPQNLPKLELFKRIFSILEERGKGLYP